MKKHFLISSLMGLFLAAMPAMGQSSTAGDVAGTLTDPTGASIPGAQIKLTNTGTGETKTVASDAGGAYRFSLLSPGTYKVSATAPGFSTTENTVTVTIGSVTQDNLKLAVGQQGTTIEVSSQQIPLIDTDNVALITTLNEQQIQDLPAPGGDVTTVAFTLPGVVVNNGGEYGNFSSNGLPGISNLFVLNGFDNEDPFLNLNNSGSSNLTLGQGELEEASVVQNGYSSQFGRAAGAIIFYNTKSGTNKLHGLLDYYGDTSQFNANGWFYNYSGTPRPHAVSNEWAANVGGPIWKDKLFFFSDYEGLRYVLPGGSGYTNFPTPALQTYILGNVPAAATSLYQQAFTAYQGAPSYKSAVPVNGTTGPTGDPNGALGCGNLAGTPTGTGGTFGVDTPCIMTAYSSSNNINKEWLFTFRGDYVINDHNRIYARFKTDHGSQPTSTSTINPLFSTTSIQPESEGQFNWTSQITPAMTNSFTMSGTWYSAYFGPSNPTASAAVYPDNLVPSTGVDSSGTNEASGLAQLGVPYYLTQGRDVTMYQVRDDWTLSHGHHIFKAGFDFRRADITDYDQQEETVFPYVQFNGLADYASGQFVASNQYYEAGDNFNQAYSAVTHAYIALYNVGIYGQDEYQVTPKLKLTLGARVDRTGNPLCNNDCFSRYTGSVFPTGIAAADTTGGFASAYNSAEGGPIASRNQHPFADSQAIVMQGRAGFNYGLDSHTEIRGGFGMFGDLYPAVFVDNVIENFPNYNSVEVQAGGIYGAGSGSGTVRNNAAVGNSTLQSAFTSGGTLTSINNTLTTLGVPFQPPTIAAYFPKSFKSPEYLEYSLQLQRQLGPHDSFNITYAGNHGYNLLLQNPFVNAANGEYSSTTNSYAEATTGPTGNSYGFNNVPVTPADPRFSRVTAFTNNGYSNYNGLQLSYKHIGHGITTDINYTYSHDLDTASNGGVGSAEPWNAGSITNQITPYLKTQNLNYSDADQDVRNNLAGDLVYDEPYHFSNFFENLAAGGWIVGLKSYYHGGTTFSVTNGEGLNGFTNLGTALMPDVIGDPQNSCHNGRAAVVSQCLNGLAFYGFAQNGSQNTTVIDVTTANPAGVTVPTNPQTDFGNVRRNSFRGPGFVDTDMLLTKRVVKFGRADFVVGANAYNLFNHPNFANPNSTLGLSNFGTISNTVSPPTSPFGSFQGNGVTQRLLQLHAKLTF